MLDTDFLELVPVMVFFGGDVLENSSIRGTEAGNTGSTHARGTQLDFPRGQIQVEEHMRGKWVSLERICPMDFLPQEGQGPARGKQND